MIKDNYSVFGNLWKKADGDNAIFTQVPTPCAASSTPCSESLSTRAGLLVDGSSAASTRVWRASGLAALLLFCSFLTCVRHCQADCDDQRTGGDTSTPRGPPYAARNGVAFRRPPAG